jgi:hypothetical protein
MCQNFKFGQPFQRMLTGFATHFARRLQAGAAARALRLGENPAAQVRIQMAARLARWLVQRTDRRRNAARAAPWATFKNR